jgi:hypothetical protein
VGASDGAGLHVIALASLLIGQCNCRQSGQPGLLFDMDMETLGRECDRVHSTCVRVIAPYPGGYRTGCEHRAGVWFRMETAATGIVAEAWAPVSGTTFSELVWNTRYFGEERGEVLSAWLEQQPSGEDLVAFDGTIDELGLVSGHVQGIRTRVVVSKVAYLMGCSVYSTAGASFLFKGFGRSVALANEEA